MSWLGWLATFLGQLLAMLLPAIDREIRKNNTVQQKGYDDETNAALDSDIWTTAGSDRVQRHSRHIRTKNRAPP